MHFGKYVQSVLLLYYTITVIGIIAGDQKTEGKLDPDGFPPIGTLLQEGDPYYWYIAAILYFIYSSSVIVYVQLHR